MITPKDIIVAASKVTGFNETSIKSKQRTQALANTRQVCVYLMRKHLKLSSEEVSIALGMCRSNINYAVSQVKFKLLIGDKYTTQLLNELNSNLFV